MEPENIVTPAVSSVMASLFCGAATEARRMTPEWMSCVRGSESTVSRAVSSVAGGVLLVVRRAKRAYLIVRCGVPAGDALRVGDVLLEAMRAEGAEGDAGGAVERADGPEDAGHGREERVGVGRLSAG